MVNITAVRMVGGELHEHIARVKWINPTTKMTGENTRAQMVEWIDNKGGKAYVAAGTNTVQVGVVNASPKYIRTYADGTWTNNLLALPRF